MAVEFNSILSQGVKDIVIDTQNNKVTYFHRKGRENDKKSLKNSLRYWT